ncbi:DUF4279 domain-containing protein [Herbiconiux ginsengi]|uniref:DUF4279 domain-containing protein n=1 Tax=Herbiconiux ginsengi TaxID=381665 RepID=A0A1H3S3S3_9MICO|nr:DUF4279 domain-containing protein [Herbiconiux ginsengi]SDZ32666.1 protein of unknown function [Herbiconiux ginsengi]
MIQWGRATFSVNSTATTPERISEILGLIPTTVAHAGSERRLGKPRSHHHWSIDGPRAENTATDQTGKAALAELVSLISPVAENIQNLPADCDVAIWWSADSDSTQGGFVLPAELLRAIAALGVDVYATVYLESDGAHDRDD